MESDNGSSSPPATDPTPMQSTDDDDYAAVNQTGLFSDLDVILATTSQIKKPVAPVAVVRVAEMPHGKLPMAPKAVAKIAPKPPSAAAAATTTTTSAGAAGSHQQQQQQQQFVLIQSQNGKGQQIRLAAANAGAGATGTAGHMPAVQSVGPTPISGNIQLIKSSDGNSFIQLKPAGAPAPAAGAAAVAANTKTISATASGNTTCIVLKSVAGGQRVVVGSAGGPPAAAATGAANVVIASAASAATGAGAAAGANASRTPQAAVVAPSSMPRTLTVAQAQQMGLLTPAKLKELVTAARAQKIAKQQQAAAAAAAAAAVAVAAPATTAAVAASTSSSLPASEPSSLPEIDISPVPAAPSVVAVATNPTAPTTTSTNAVTAKPAVTIRPCKSAATSLAGPAVAPAADCPTSAPIARPPKPAAGPVPAPAAVDDTGTTAVAAAAAVPTVVNAVAPAAPAKQPTTKSAPRVMSHPVTIQSLDGSKKHVLLPPNLYKMAKQGQIQAVNVIGKGVQLRINTNAPPQHGKVVVVSSSGPTVPTTVVAAAGPSMSTAAGASSTQTAAAAAVVKTEKLEVSKLEIDEEPTTTPAAPVSSNGMQPLKLLQPKADTPPTAVVKTEPMDTAENAWPVSGLKRKQAAGGGGGNATGSSSNAVAAATLLNRTLKMEDTIDPDTLTQRFVPSASLGQSRRSIAGADGLLLNQDIKVDPSSSSMLTYAFDIPRKSLKSGFGAAQVTESITATMVDMSGSALSSSQPPRASAVPSASESEAEGPRRKHCNCTKSQCLKLYCDCFANGEFCKDCNCKDCFNNIDYEEERQKAIRICLERNPHAFKPKIGQSKDTPDSALRRHNKGCNCKRSGCLKNYCECYEAKILCSANCKCVDCHNMDEFTRLNVSGHDDTHHHRHAVDGSASSSSSSVVRGGGGHSHHYQQQQQQQLAARAAELERLQHERSESPDIPPKKPCNFMTPDVIEATIQCVIAQADECQKNTFDAKAAEYLILEEFGRCLVEIIDFSTKNPELDSSEE